ARQIDRTQGESQCEAAALALDLALPESREWPLENVLYAGDDHRDAEQDQGGESSPANRVLRDRQSAQDKRAEQGEDAEAECQAGDDEIGPRIALVSRGVGIHAAREKH